VIRFARPGDIPALLEIQQKVSDALPHPDGIGFNRDHAAQVMVNAMQARNACLIVSDPVASAIGGSLIPVWFDQSQIVARTFLYWGAGDGPLLLDAFAAWGREMGATRVRADALDYRTKATARAYRRNGFRPVEHVYERVL
jgi:GNAT superfamily N-acetyltransferase